MWDDDLLRRQQENAQAYRDKFWVELECAKEESKLAVAKIKKLQGYDVCNFCGAEVSGQQCGDADHLDFCNNCEFVVEGNTTRKFREV